MKTLLLLICFQIVLIFVLKACLPDLLHPNIFVIFVFVVFSALIAHLLGKYGLNKDLQAAYLYFLGGMMIRLFCSLILIGLYLFYTVEPKNLRILAILNFVFFYFSFAIAEVNSFLTNLRHKYKNL